MPAARLAVIAGAGHMGPLTHASEVNAAIVRHIEQAQTRARFIDIALPALRRFKSPDPFTHTQTAKGLI